VYWSFSTMTSTDGGQLLADSQVLYWFNRFVRLLFRRLQGLHRFGAC